MNQIAALIVFAEGTTHDQANEFLEKVKKLQNAMLTAIESIRTKEFNPDYGGVTIYQP